LSERTQWPQWFKLRVDDLTLHNFCNAPIKGIAGVSTPVTFIGGTQPTFFPDALAIIRIAWNRCICITVIPVVAISREIKHSHDIPLYNLGVIVTV